MPLGLPLSPTLVSWSLWDRQEDWCSLLQTCQSQDPQLFA